MVSLTITIIFVITEMFDRTAKSQQWAGPSTFLHNSSLCIPNHEALVRRVVTSSHPHQIYNIDTPMSVWLFASFTKFPQWDPKPFSFPSLHLTQLILKPFRSFTYVTAHSLTLLSLLLRHRLFTYVTWRAAHDVRDTGTEFCWILKLP